MHTSTNDSNFPTVYIPRDAWASSKVGIDLSFMVIDDLEASLSVFLNPVPSFSR